MNQEEIYYAAMLSKDHRFDGKFFIGVKTTGIYCRPICPAKPKKENIIFYSSSLEAEKAGYRPCLRCHPERSPELAHSLGKSAVVQKALHLISQNTLFEMSLSAFAEKMGLSLRHLRRLFQEELGLSPKKVADTHRLNYACQLIQETSLKLTTIAFSSGFSSLRGFNTAFKERFRQTPRQKRLSPTQKSTHDHTLYLPYRPPFDWNATLSYFRHHQIPYVEKVTQTYERLFMFQGSLGLVQIKNLEERFQLEVKVHCSDPKALLLVVNNVRKMFDLASDPLFLYQRFSQSSFLKGLWEEWPGLRLARGWDPFEIAIGTILGQVVSVERASQLMGQMAKLLGEKVTHPFTQQDSYLFPTPEKILQSPLGEIKTTTARKRAIHEFCARVSQGEIQLTEFTPLTQLRQQLYLIRGFGCWTVEYICLRGLGDVNAFPANDLILQKALKLHPLLDLEKIDPWRAYVAIYLWQKYTQKHSKI